MNDNDAIPEAMKYARIPTLDEAKTRWNKHTRHVVTDEVRALARQHKEWLMTGTVPTLVVGLPPNRLCFGFSCNERGTGIWVFDLTNGQHEQHYERYDTRAGYT